MILVRRGLKMGSSSRRRGPRVHAPGLDVGLGRYQLVRSGHGRSGDAFAFRVRLRFRSKAARPPRRGTPSPSPRRDPLPQGDTWEWADGVGRGWAMAVPVCAITRRWPTIRSVASLSCSEGGTRSRLMLSDTWLWDGTSWREVDAPGPPPRATHRLVWDAERKVLVLFGGWGAEGLLADTWTGTDAPGRRRTARS